METNGQELSIVLATLREDLARAQKQGKGHELHFAIEEIEVELNVVVTKEGAGKAGAKFWVINANLEGKLGNVATQKIKLKMKLVDKTGGSPEIADDEER